ncbi:hypothetical protein [Brochothrix thermosphacta]|uniref:hypothetical protein n=1 Tax=Brochothrix thermosphacta TaxID=2756 RepID=UPI00083FA915|nr:hypothetical protein [Brochothrix thermosphacta]ODJ71977.1 hypothetical protein BFR39_04355 [Brochothrix thermosphacta]
MLNVSDAFQNAFKADLREIKMRITINKKVYTQDDLNSFSYEGGSMAGESFMIGSVFSNSIKITLDKVVEGLKELDEINPEIGIKLPNGTIEYVSMGIFIINSRVDPDRNENKTTIEAADKFIMMGGVYVSKLKYPAEIKAVALEIANLSGIKVNTTTFSRLSAAKITKMEGYTYRQAIGLIAQFESGYALFDRTGLLDIRNMFDAAANTEYVITPDTYFQKGLVKNEMLYRLGGISCKVPGNDDTEEKVLRAGSETGAQIELENKVMTQTLLNTIYQKIKNINYFPYTLKWRGNPALEAGDWIRMSDVKGNTFKVPNLDYKLEYTGGLSADSSAETTTQSDASYSYKGPLAQKIEDLTNRVDAAGGNVINEGLDEPKNPKEGDLWFKPNGPDTEIWVYQRIGDTDEFEWVFRVTTAEDPFIKETIEQAQQDIIKAKEEAAKAQQKADEAAIKAQEGFDKAEALSEKVDENTDEISTIKQTAEGLQISVESKAEQSTVTQLAGQVTQTVTQLNTKKLNFIQNGSFKEDYRAWAITGVKLQWLSNTNGSQPFVGRMLGATLNDAVTSNAWITQVRTDNMIGKLAYKKWTMSGYYYVANEVSGFINIYTRTTLDDGTYRYFNNAVKYPSSGGWKKFSFLIDHNGITGGKITDFRVSIGLSNAFGGNVYFSELQIEEGEIATPYSDNSEDYGTQSQITQLADNINLKVDKNGIINQINISPEGILIAGENVWISGKTKIDNAVIKNAMIDSLSANKLTAGTIDAGKINVVNLNASNISAGIITGANLAINLNSGEVTFQKGIIKRADELFSIDVTKGIVESYDSNGGFTISKGEITLNSSPALTTGNSKKYGTITYKWKLLDASGLALIGEEGFSLGTSNADLSIGIGQVNTGSAISGTRAGVLNVFSRQSVELSSGNLYDSGGSLNLKMLARISIGNTSTSNSQVSISANTVRLSAKDGDHILLSSDSTSALVQSTVIYRRTYASAANMYITLYGTIGRSTSASKYKLAIEEDKTDNYKNILKLKHKTWYDKDNTEAYARALDNKDAFDWDNPEDEVLPVERIHGLIAEDLVEAGLTEFVSYGELNDDGTKEVEGIQYDRLVVPLLQIVKDHQIEIEKLKERIK